MSDIEEPPTKISKFEMSNTNEEDPEEMEEGQEEWLSEGLLTDDDYNQTVDPDQTDSNLDDSSHDEAPTSMPSVNTSVEADTQQEKKIENTDIEKTLTSMNDQSQMSDDLDTYLVRKTDVKVSQQEDVTDDGNDTDDLLRLLEEGDEKSKKKVLVKTVKDKSSREKAASDQNANEKSLKTRRNSASTDEDDDFVFEGTKMTKLRVAKNALIRKYPAAKAVPEDMSDGDDDETDASSDEAKTMKKMFGVKEKRTNLPSNTNSKQPQPQPKSMPKKIIQVTTAKVEHTPSPPQRQLRNTTIASKLSPKPVVKPSPQQNFKPSPQSNFKPTPQSNFKPSPQLNFKPSSQPNFKASPQPNIKMTPMPNVKPTPKPNVKLSPKPNVYPSPKSNVNLSPKPNVKLSPKPNVYPSPKSNLNLSPKPNVKPSPNPIVKPPPKPIVKPSPNTIIKSAQQINNKPPLRTIPKPPMKSTPKPASKEVNPPSDHEEIINEEEFLEEEEDYELDEDFADASESEFEASGRDRQLIMKPEQMDEEIPTDVETDSEDGSLYDELPSSDSDDLDDWFSLDIRSERAADYIPLLGTKAYELLSEEKRRVSERLTSLRARVAELSESGRRQDELIRKASMTLTELDDLLKAT